MHADLVADYITSTKRLFLLDYDGTLADLKPTPPEAVPTPQMLHILRQLAADNRNTVVIVSGRRYQDMDEWLGQLPIYLVAEHGSLRKSPGHAWKATLKTNGDWKPTIHHLMEAYCALAPGTFIEEKATSLAWHYGASDNMKEARKVARGLASQLAEEEAALGLHTLQENHTVEAVPKAISKAMVARHWLGQKDWGFVFGAGDGATDEHLFQALPATAWSIKVGSGKTAARFHLAAPRDLRTLLESLIDTR